MPGMMSVLTLWKSASRLPGGERVFSFVFGRRAPYFASIRPRFTEIRPNRAALLIRDRRRVHNHLGTVHAIALCNGLEAAMGALAEATIPPTQRWIPQGMEVRYTAKADSDVLCIAETDRRALDRRAPTSRPRHAAYAGRRPSWSRAPSTSG